MFMLLLLLLLLEVSLKFNSCTNYIPLLFAFRHERAARSSLILVVVVIIIDIVIWMCVCIIKLYHQKKNIPLIGNGDVISTKHYILMPFQNIHTRACIADTLHTYEKKTRDISFQFSILHINIRR